MFKFAALLGAAAAIDFQQVGDDASLHCLENNTFCQRTREWKLDQNDPTAAKDIQYALTAGHQIQPQSSTSSVAFRMDLGCQPMGFLAQQLLFSMTFYKGGIVHVMADRPDMSRFRIS